MVRTHTAEQNCRSWAYQEFLPGYRKADSGQGKNLDRFRYHRKAGRAGNTGRNRNSHLRLSGEGSP